MIARLSEDHETRNKLMRFSFPSKDGDAVIDPRPVQRLWDGMRILPYADRDIADGIGACVSLVLWARELAKDGMHGMRSVFSQCYGDFIEVEFGATQGMYSRAYAAAVELRKAFRDDLEEYLKPRYKKDVMERPDAALQAIWSPAYLFNFDRLVSLFARQIVPSQVLVRRMEQPIYFSPARLEAFGLP